MASGIVLSAILILLIAEGCASIGNPSGGPRDERPPRFVSASPAPGSVDIPLNHEKFTLNFNELIEVKDAMSKVIVSPPSKNIPRVAAQGKKVIVTFQDSLQPNTTYTIDFADAIQDLNEGNPLKNFAYTFSTGPTIDSLRIAGRVLSAHAMEPMQLKLVGLYRVDSLAVDSAAAVLNPLNFNQSVHKNLFTRRFDRVGRTDDTGRFSIEGLAPGRYRIYALDDINSDYIFTNADEEVAFLDVDISPSTAEAVATDTIFNLKTGSIDTVIQRRRTIFLPNDIILRSALSRRAQQYIEKYERIDSTRVNIIFHVPNAEMPRISIVGYENSPDLWRLERSAGNDTLSLWLDNPDLIKTDTLRFAVDYLHLDSVQQYQLKADTLRLTTDRNAINKAHAQAQKLLDKQAKQLQKNARRQGANNPDDPDKPEAADAIASSAAKPKQPLLRIDFKSGSTQDVNRPVILETSVPPIRIDTALFKLEEKVDTIWRTLPLPPIQTDSLNPRQISIGGNWKPDTEYRLVMDSLAINGMYGLTSAKTEHSFRTKEEKQYCTLTMRLSDWPAGRPAFMELLNSSDAPVAIAPLVGNTVKFDYLSPGKYYLRIIDDLNADGRRDSGDPLLNLQPEESYYYPKAINLKQNWNKEESWAVFSTPVDKMKPEAILKNRPKQPTKQGRKQPAKQPDDEEEEE